MKGLFIKDLRLMKAQKHFFGVVLMMMVGMMVPAEMDRGLVTAVPVLLFWLRKLLRFQY